ncbi:hypothetical protein P4S65_10755 [Pseudoalteromonas sp. B131b]|nr:hypothetical protein [Pseudoalteromonas sp. 1_2015MBL_MicDiv]
MNKLTLRGQMKVNALLDAAATVLSCSEYRKAAKHNALRRGSLFTLNKSHSNTGNLFQTPIKTTLNQLFIFDEKHSNRLNQNRNSAMVYS